MRGDIQVEFRLVYQGKLPTEGRGSSSAVKDKHSIRQAVHKQLVNLWTMHPFISKYSVRPAQETKQWPDADYRTTGKTHSYLWPFKSESELDRLSEKYAMCGFNFAPLIGGIFGEGRETACALDILFLRRDIPGRVVAGGDIDNRLKVLFDALRMPKNCDEVKGFTPEPDEKPFLCLLEDDSLITEVSVTTDLLLAPRSTNEHVNDVHLVIRVKTLAVGINFAGAEIGPEPPPPPRPHRWDR